MIPSALGEPDQYESNCNDISIEQTQIISEQQVFEFYKTYRSVSNKKFDIRLLFSDQKEVLSICRRQISEENYPIKRVLVQGQAGTGKTTLIRVMSQVLDDEENKSSSGKLYQALAFTLSAARIVMGETIHGFLKIPLKKQHVQKLDQSNLESLRRRLKSIKFILIDNCNMVGIDLLQNIHDRLCQARGSSIEVFGGYNVYLFGDFRQLPPVNDEALYMYPESNLIRSFQKRFILQVCHRNRSNRTRFKEILDKIGDGSATQREWRDLRRRLSGSECPPNEQIFREAVHIFPTNDLVDEHNSIVENSNRQQATKIEVARYAREQTTYIKIWIGCRVALTRSICLKKGLGPSSMGTIGEILYYPNSLSTPSVIMVEFDNYEGPFFPGRGKLFPIVAYRGQFPIKLAYALTCYRAQGLNLDRAVVQWTFREQWPGMIYAALSRVQDIDDLLIIGNYYYNPIQPSPETRDQINMRESFIESLVYESQQEQIVEESTSN